MKTKQLLALIYYIVLPALVIPDAALSQVNTGSNGSDGIFNPTTNIVVNMTDHPTGIYQYNSVNIPAGVSVTFIPNLNNTPVVWLVQSNVIINGTLNVSGGNTTNFQGALGGPGGYQGGNGSNGNPPPTPGQGPGGGSVIGGPTGNGTYNYGNSFLIPLLGGSGGAGIGCGIGGGGGGGAILIAASFSITVNGEIDSNWGFALGHIGCGGGFAGSGGAIRLVCSQIVGNGGISTGNGRVRFDTYDDEFAGNLSGNFSQGFQPIIIPSAGQLAQLTVTSIGGVPVSVSPTGVLSTPDAVLSAQQNNPIPITVSCANLPLNSQITVSVKPGNGAAVSATGVNNTGTLSSSTATISIAIPRGGGLIYATAATSN